MKTTGTNIRLIDIINEIKVQRPPDANKMFRYWVALRHTIAEADGDTENDFNKVGEILNKYLDQFDGLTPGGFQTYSLDEKFKMLTQEERNALYSEFLPYLQKYGISL